MPGFSNGVLLKTPFGVKIHNVCESTQVYHTLQEVITAQSHILLRFILPHSSRV